MNAEQPPESAATDIVIVGGGHNGLAAAAYLARAGLAVTVLERLPTTGGAAVSTAPFAGVDARLSRYSYLVSLLPQQIIDDLGLDLAFAERRYSSYTPVPGDPARALLIDTADLEATRESFTGIGAGDDADLFHEFYRHCRDLTEKLWPTLTEPLRRRSDARELVGADNTWHAMIERPIGEIITRHLQNDVVRGVIATDALIGTFARLDDPDLQQNICFLYHLIGQGDGSWNIPIGGMGTVTDELRRVALKAGATIVTGAEVTAVTMVGGAVPGARMPGGTVPTVRMPGGTVPGAPTSSGSAAAGEPSTHSGGPTASPEVRYVLDHAEHTLHATTVLANVAPLELNRLLEAGGASGALPVPKAPEGAQVKVNLLLARLPRLRDARVTPEQAFGGTFHINETYTQLDAAYDEAAAGRLPNPLPCEIYAHSLADPSILSPELQAAGAQTLTVFALQVPHRLAATAAAAAAEGVDAPGAFRATAQAAVLASLDSVLAEPIEDCLLLGANGEPCIETKTTLDIEEALRMPGGNIFHGPLSWPFVDDDAPLDSAAERWGVATAHPQLLLCGSGARRGGAVSALGGHNAAMAVLEQRGLEHRPLGGTGAAAHPLAATAAGGDTEEEHPE
ncbi:phytoene desaturase family protein [Subtercola endophyticus]|uniref:phytoene desaturase family protein n=1 Tax=Subtercola endophyticus TaxID=2895559 RepID=UPI001E488171|nr:NAD(P)/FAD-dependent oxidoreductase [Subtercola endophyticus]UFS58429.1 NAD(P)/FAD-dependent oxidoreductase [Subtercola endophyticus]